MKPTYVEEIDWKGAQYTLEFFKTHDFSDISPKAQSGGICFADDDHVVLFKHIGGYTSMPGGTIEEGETPGETLKREVMEEVTCEVVEYGPIGYFRVSRKNEPGRVWYQLRYWAKVNCLEETPDPDGKTLHRVIVPYDKASDELGWGERGKYLFELAREELIK